MEKSSITTDIVVDPEHYHPDKFYDYILSCLKDKEKTCTLENGYIDHILYQINHIENFSLLHEGSCRIRVTFEGYCFKPIIGKTLTTTVEIIFPHGIFSSLYVLKFLVPYKCLENDYIYISDVGYKNRHTSKVISIGSKINIVITNLKYDKGHYSCIADLSH